MTGAMPAGRREGGYGSFYAKIYGKSHREDLKIVRLSDERRADSRFAHGQ